MITTAFYAGIFGLVYIILTVAVARERWRYRVGLGTGENCPRLEQIVRIHGNYIEYVPLGLILMMLLETAGWSVVIIHILGGTLLLGRLFHMIGIYKTPGASVARGLGMGFTLLMIIAASILCLWSALHAFF